MSAADSRRPGTASANTSQTNWGRDWSQHWDSAKTLLLVAWAMAIIPNTVEAFADPTGAAWTITRYCLSTLFLLALAYFVIALVQHKVRRTSGQ